MPDLYLDLVERAVAGRLFKGGQTERRLADLWQRVRHPYAARHGAHSWPLRAHTMIGDARLQNLRELVERTLRENVAGDYIERAFGARRGVHLRARHSEATRCHGSQGVSR